MNYKNVPVNNSTTPVNLRQTPSTSAAIVTKIPVGHIVVEDESANAAPYSQSVLAEWMPVVYCGIYKGWVAKKFFVETTESATIIPSDDTKKNSNDNSNNANDYNNNNVIPDNTTATSGNGKTWMCAGLATLAIGVGIWAFL